MDRRRAGDSLLFFFFSFLSLLSLFFSFQICHEHGLGFDTRLSFHLLVILLALIKVGRLLLLLEDLLQIRFNVLYS